MRAALSDPQEDRRAVLVGDSGFQSITDCTGARSRERGSTSGDGAVQGIGIRQSVESRFRALFQLCHLAAGDLLVWRNFMQVWSPGSGLDRLECSNDLEQPIADALFPPSARGFNNAGYGLGIEKQSASLRLLTSVSGSLHSSRSIPDSRVLIGFRAEIECRKTIIAAPIFTVHLSCRNAQQDFSCNGNPCEGPSTAGLVGLTLFDRGHMSILEKL